MCPLNKILKNLGFKNEKGGAISFKFTEEEKRSIESTFRTFKNSKVHPDYAEEMEKALTAFSLSNYAIGAVKFGLESKEVILQKAISAITKAYSIYQLPFFLYELADYMEQDGKVEEAKTMYRKFLNSQVNYKISPIDKALLVQRDLDEAIRISQLKAK